MIRKVALFLIPAMAAATSAAVVEKVTEYRKEVLENRFMMLEFLPDSLGRLNQIILKSTGKKLLIGRTLTKVSVDPLYGFFRNNSFGCGENFWKNYVASRDGKSRVTHPDNCTVVFGNNWYGGLSVNMKRKTQLPEEEMLFTFEAEVVNRDGMRDFYLAPWYSLVPDNAGNTKLLVPVKGNKKSHTPGNVKFFADDCIAENPSGLLYPGDNWIATAYPGEKLILAAIIPPEEIFPDGAFYSWHGKEEDTSYRSMEVIFNGKTLVSGAVRKFKCTFAVFCGLEKVQDIAGTTAVDYTLSGDELQLTFAPARKIAAGKGMVKICGEKAEKVVELDFPELHPGQAYDFTITPDCGKIRRISGKIASGCEFVLPEVKQEK